MQIRNNCVETHEAGNMKSSIVSVSALKEWKCFRRTSLGIQKMQAPSPELLDGWSSRLQHHLEVSFRSAVDCLDVLEDQLAMFESVRLS